MLRNKSKIFWRNIINTNKMQITFLLIVALINVILTLVPSIVVQWYIDHVLYNKLLDAFFLAFVFILGSNMLEQIIKVFFQYKYSKLIFSILCELRDFLYRTLIGLSYLQYRKEYNRSLNIFTNDINSLTNSGMEGLPSMLVSILVSLGASIYVAKINLWLLIGVILISILSLIPIHYTNKKQNDLVKDAQKYEQIQTQYIKECVDKPLFIKTNYKIKYIVNKMERTANNLLKSSLKRELNFRLFLIALIVSNALINTFVLGIGSYLYFNGSITIGQITACVTLVKFITNPLMDITTYYMTIKDIIPRIKRINNLLSMKTEIDEEQNDQKEQFEVSDFYNIGLCNVSVSIEDKNIISNINLELLSNKNYMISGNSGVGKSTLFNLLLQIIKPSKGEIFINGNSYSKIRSSDIRNLFSISAQDAFFFNDTIEQNLKIVNTSTSNEEIERALYLSCCDEFVYSLDKGIYTVLMENGTNLSGGQRQRLGVARAILANKTFLLLDEVTSELNPKLRKMLLDRLYTESNFSILQISHSNEGIEYCDEIIRIENNKIIVEKNNRKLYYNKISL